MKNLSKRLSVLLVALVAVVFVSAQSVYRLNENFDAVTSGLPAGWDNSRGTTNNSAYRWASDGSGVGGSRCVRFDSYSNPDGSTNYLITPVMDLSAGQWMLTFSYLNPAGGSLDVLLSNDGGTTFPVTLATELTRAATWTTVTYPLTAASGTQVKIAFLATSNHIYQQYIRLDDVRVQTAASCKAPTGVSFFDLTQTSATLRWGLTSVGAIPGTYSITVTDVAGTVLLDTAGVPAPNMSYPLTGLTANTTYNVTIQGDCSGSMQGESEAVTATFTTLCYPQAAPYLQSFDAS